PLPARRIDLQSLDLLFRRNGADGELRRFFPVFDPLLLQLLRSEHVSGVPEEFTVAKGEIAAGVLMHVMIAALLVLVDTAAAGGQFLLAGGATLAVRLHLER